MVFGSLELVLIVLEFLLGVVVAYVLRKLSQQDEMLQEMREYYDRRFSNIEDSTEAKFKRYRDSCSNYREDIKSSIKETSKLTQSDHDVLMTIDSKVKSIKGTIEDLKEELRRYYKRKNGN